MSKNAASNDVKNAKKGAVTNTQLKLKSFRDLGKAAEGHTKRIGDSNISFSQKVKVLGRTIVA